MCMFMQYAHTLTHTSTRRVRKSCKCLCSHVEAKDNLEKSVLSFHHEIHQFSSGRQACIKLFFRVSHPSSPQNKSFKRSTEWEKIISPSKGPFPRIHKVPLQLNNNNKIKQSSLKAEKVGWGDGSVGKLIPVQESLKLRFSVHV